LLAAHIVHKLVDPNAHVDIYFSHEVVILYTQLTIASLFSIHVVIVTTDKLIIKYPCIGDD